jgi:hypothetical protein
MPRPIDPVSPDINYGRAALIAREAHDLLCLRVLRRPGSMTQSGLRSHGKELQALL